MEHIFALPLQTMPSTLEKTINIQISHATDIGGGRENQDDFFIFQKPEEKITVVAILDGHGIEHGKLASGSARDFLTTYFETNYLLLKTNPYETLVNAYSGTHNHLKEWFTQSLTNNNYKVMESKEGYLLKRYTDNQPWQSLRGGTTCTIIAIIDKMVYCSNVGDSTATLCSKVPIFNPEKQLTYLGDSATPSSTPFTQPVSTSAESTALSTTMEINANHSPDNPSEFCRLRQFQQRLGNPLHPASHLVYDSKLNDKVRCSPIFTVDASGNPTITNNGTYCKNVRHEYATLLTTPSTARFSESLAFTRSVGDFYMQTYGVTYCPEIHSIDLDTLFDDLDKKQQQQQQTPLCLVVASDGVWDNWIFEDVTDYVLSDDVVESSNKKEKTAAELLIQQNDIYARANFGNNSDNATAIIVYLNRE